MPQTISKLAISWGLVSIPVTVHAATAQHPVPLHLVHTQCGAGRIRLRRYCEHEGIEVLYGEVARGWQSPDGRVVMLSDDDLADLPLPSSPQAIDVLAFVPADQIDPLLLHRPYYLGIGDPTAARPYALLRDAMRESDLVAVVRVTLRTRESLALLRVRDEVIAMQTLMWPDELRPTDDIAVPPTEPPRRQELQMARTLMDTISGDFHLEEERDAYRHALEQVVAARLEGLEPPHAPVPVEGGLVDLMTALEQSVKAAKPHRATAATKKPRPRQGPAR
ncbi:non-homologous end joining protein Ku [Streptomyces sp. NPDC001020]